MNSVAEVIRRGGIPFVLGGSSEQCSGVAAGLIGVLGGSVGVLSIHSHLDLRPSVVSLKEMKNVFL